MKICTRLKINQLFRTVFSLGNASGQLLHFDAKTREFLEELNLCQGQIQVVKYSPAGTYLGIGTSSGSIFYWPALEGDRNEPLMCSNRAIQKLKFSQDESILAFIDGHNCIGVFDVSDNWSIKYRLKPHSKPITDFALNYPEIYAVSQDRKVSKVENGVVTLKKSIDPSADPILVQTLVDFVIVATEAEQVRILNPETLLCRKILSTEGIPKVKIWPMHFNNGSTVGQFFRQLFLSVFIKYCW